MIRKFNKTAGLFKGNLLSVKLIHLKDKLSIMKKHTILTLAIATALVISFMAFKPAPKPAGNVYVFKQFSTVESIIPGGLGRSRLITTDEAGTTVEKELKNFYSLAGINFSNITNNDAVIVDRINQMSKDGWELYSVTAGVQSQSDKGSGGIYLTRYLFRKPI